MNQESGFDTSTFLTAFLSSSAVAGIAIFYIKNFLLNQLHKDLENHKFSLQREVIKAQILSGHSAETYKQLFKDIEISYGATSRLLSPFQVVNDWSKAGEEDVEDYLVTREASREDINNMMAAFKRKDVDRGDKMNKLLEFLNIQDAESKWREAKNYLIANALFVDEKVESKSHEILKEIFSGIVSLQSWAKHGDRTLVMEEYKKDNELRKKIDSLKDDIRKILSPISN